MKISIIIPTYNEEKTINQMIKMLQPIKNRCEIIFVDGGSTDKTQAIISKDFILQHSLKGRAKQMNYGAVKSTGDILFFLHCDSVIPKTALEEIESVMRDYHVGCFGIRFDSKNILMKCCQYMSNRRVKKHKVMFGDQGIFIDRKLFFKMGMFPVLPIMEDYQFSLNLKAKGTKIGMTKNRILTSDRRFPDRNIGKIKVMWQMNYLRARYRNGLSIEKIAGIYYDIR